VVEGRGIAHLCRLVLHRLPKVRVLLEEGLVKVAPKKLEEHLHLLEPVVRGRGLPLERLEPARERVDAVVTVRAHDVTKKLGGPVFNFSPQPSPHSTSWRSSWGTSSAWCPRRDRPRASCPPSWVAPSSWPWCGSPRLSGCHRSHTPPRGPPRSRTPRQTFVASPGGF